jgi:hypothetical protein
MICKPLPPKDYTLLTKQARCPKCDATCIVKIGPPDGGLKPRGSVQ